VELTSLGLEPFALRHLLVLSELRVRPNQTRITAAGVPLTLRHDFDRRRSEARKMLRSRFQLVTYSMEGLYVERCGPGYRFDRKKVDRIN
jgi:hypothetical protein